MTCHPSRIEPPCRYYGTCGGCDLQHASYALQLTIKKDIVKELLLRQTNSTVKEAAAQVADPLGSPSELNYRQRIRLQVGNNGELGFNQYRSNNIVPIDSCLLATPEINTTLQTLRKNEDAHDLIELSSEVQILYNPSSQKCTCIFNFTRKPRPANLSRAKKICQNNPLIEKIFIAGKNFPLQGPFNAETSTSLHLSFSHLCPEASGHPITFQWEAGAFCQVNLPQNAQLIDLVINLIQPDSSEDVLDLYCGMGNFSIPLAFLAKEVHGIEGQGSSIRSAKKNSLTSGLANTYFHKNKVHTACSAFVGKGRLFDHVVVDPPRQGIPDLAPQLAILCRKRLVYISCDPATLSRDLGALTTEGFTISKILPVDMFPQTHHIECVVLLEKN